MAEQMYEPEILFDDDVFYRIKQVLKSAKVAEDVYLVTPYIKLDTRIKEAIEEARDNKVAITLFIRADADHPLDDIKWLIQKHVTIRKVDKLHAKIYLGSSIGLVASMNLHSFSGNESKEAGICFTDQASLKRLHEKVKKWEAQSTEVDFSQISMKPEIQGRSVVHPSSPPSTTKEKSVLVSEVKKKPIEIVKSKGFCIRCGEQKTFNPKYPLCDDCYRIWAKYSDDTYEENNCHKCGKPSSTSVARPLCRPCWSEENRKTN